MRAATEDGETAGEGAAVGAAVGCGVGATVRDGDGATGAGVSVMLGAVLPAAGGDSVREAAALPSLGDESPPEPDGAPHAARRTAPTRHKDAKRAMVVTT